MLNEAKKTDLFCDYYEKWIQVYKEGAIRKVTLDKYKMTQAWLKKLAPIIQELENKDVDLVMRSLSSLS